MGLEGKYFGFEFSADYTQEFGEGSALAIFQVINGKLEQKYHPCDNTLEIGENETEKAIQYLKGVGAKELLSTLNTIRPEHNKKILGLTIGFDGHKEDKESKTRYEYRGLYHQRKNKLKKHSIELKEFIDIK